MFRRLSFLLVTSLVISVGIADTVVGQDRADNRRFVNWMVDDPVSMVSGTSGNDLLALGMMGAGVATLTAADGMVNQNILVEHRDPKILEGPNLLGDWRVAAPLSAGVFGASLLADDPKFRDAAFTSLQTVVMANLVTNSAKFLFARARPGDGEGPHDFDFMELGHTSFPSGHTATAFALVTPWVMYYPGPATYAAMAIPAGTAAARIIKGRHWLSDVAAGAAIGFAMGYYLSNRHLAFTSEKLTVTPVVEVGRAGVGLHLEF